MTPLPVLVRRLPHGADLPLPRYATQASAGMDLSAALAQPLDLAPGERVRVPTGIALALPAGYEAQVRPRSGLAAQHGVTVLNSPGTIDADYRGEIVVVLVNHGTESVQIERGMRIAQLVVAPVTTVALQLVDDLPASRRAEGGFGSTGIDSPRG